MYKCRECGRAYPSLEDQCSRCGGKILEEEKADAYIMKKGIKKVEVPKFTSDQSQGSYTADTKYKVENTYHVPSYFDEEDEDEDYEDEEDDETYEAYENYGNRPEVKKKKSIGGVLFRVVSFGIGFIIVFGGTGLIRDIGYYIANTKARNTQHEYVQQIQETVAEIESEQAAKTDIANKTTSREGTPSELLYSETFGHILQQVCGKDMASLTWEEIDGIEQVTVAYQVRTHTSSGGYTLTLGKAGEDKTWTYSYGKEGFWSDVVESGDLSLLHGLRVLDLRMGSSWSPELLTGMKNLEVFKVDQGLKIESLSQLASFTNLKELVLDDVELTNLAGIESFQNLETLTLKEMSCQDLEVLGKLPLLTSLTLEDYEIPVDSQVLGTLTNLKNISLNGDNIRNLEPLAALTNLEEVSLIETDVAKVEWLVELPQLTKLTLINNPNLKDMECLRKIPQLTHFSVKAYDTSMPVLEQLKSFEVTGINDMTPLGYMTELETLVLNGCDTNNPRQLEKLTKLQELVVNNTVGSGYSEDDIGVFFELPTLKTLRLKGGAYCIKDLEKLKKASITTLEITDATIVRDMTYISDGFISSVDYDAYAGDEVAPYVLQNPSIKELTLAGMGLTVLPAITPMESLNYLDLSYNKLADVEALKDHGKLETLKLNGNRLLDVTPLLHLPQLRQLWLVDALATQDLATQDIEAKCAVVK
ncbi:MAG: leucine-rich repeat domain-containing protein [Cellulosilyticaceae bacterium]